MGLLLGHQLKNPLLMNLKSHLGIVALLLAFCVVELRGQAFWQEINGLEGGNLDVIEQFPDGTLAGIRVYGKHAGFTSTDNGASWQAFEASEQPADIFNLSIGKAGDIFHSVWLENTTPQRFKILKSSDKGQSWQLFQDSTQIRRIEQFANGTLLGQTGGGQIFRSTDGGLTWELILPNATSCNMEGHFPGGFLISSGTGFDFEWYMSADSGMTWQALPVNPSDWVHFIASSGAYFTAGFGVLTRYDGQGGSQVVVPFTNLYKSSSMVEISPGHLLAIFDFKGLYKSDDDGLTWTFLRPVPQVFFARTEATSNGDVFMTNRLGWLGKSSDGGQNWGFAGQGLERPNVLDMKFVSEDSVLARTHHGLWRSYDGENFEIVAPETRFSSERFNLDSAHRIFLKSEGRILFSDSYGSFFTDISPLPSGSFMGDVFADKNSERLFVPTATGLHRSYDRGLTWAFLPTTDSIGQIAFAENGTIVAFAHDGAPVWTKFLQFSTDDGATWTKVNLLDEFDGWVKIQTTPSGKIYAFSKYRKGFVSSDGQNWQRIYWPHHSAHGTLELGPTDFLLWGNTDEDIFRSPNGGINWQNFPGVDPGIWATAPHQNIGDMWLSPDGRVWANLPYYRFYRTENSILNQAIVEGTVRRDFDNDCATNDPDASLRHAVVQADGANTWYTTTDSIGHYVMMLDTGQYDLSIHTPNYTYAEICPSSATVSLNVPGQTVHQDFRAAGILDCPILQVDLSSSPLRNCVPNSITVNYSNLGFVPADSVYVEIRFDPFVSLNGASVAYDSLGNGLYRFPLGTVSGGVAEAFSIRVTPDCDSTFLGQVLCFEAHIFPDSLCGFEGARLTAEANCAGDSVHLTLRNIGYASTTQLLEYYVIEDDVVLREGSSNFAPGGSKKFVLPTGNSSYWRIESEQEPTHPFPSPVVAFVADCAGGNGSAFINWLSLGDQSPTIDIECLTIVGSYDPNDKNASPEGFSAAHFIKPNGEIEYLIRFQNTGTAEAINVFVLDTLSTHLDPATVSRISASHPFTWSLSGRGILNFRFDNINLPDSNANEAASHGFVSFRIRQKANLPDGTEIRNRAAIYFDFNAPIITNETWHTVQEKFMEVVDVKTPGIPEGKISIWPNPGGDFVNLEIEKLGFGEHFLEIADAFGRVLRRVNFTGSQLRFARNGLPAGVYFFSVKNPEKAILAAGKMVFR